jgi:hypothetical protein
MTLEETTNITEFPLTDEIRQLGISRVYTRVSDTNTELMLFIELTGKENYVDTIRLTLRILRKNLNHYLLPLD